MDGLQFSKNGIEFEVHNFEFNFDDENNLIARHKDTGRELVFGKDGALKSDHQIHSTVVDDEITIGPDEGSVIAGPVSGQGGFTGGGNLRIVDADDKPLQAFRQDVDAQGFNLDDADLQNSSDTVDHDETANRTHDGDDISPNRVDANEVEAEELNNTYWVGTDGDIVDIINNQTSPGDTIFVSGGTHTTTTQIEPQDGQRIIGLGNATIDNQDSSNVVNIGDSSRVTCQSLRLVNVGIDGFQINEGYKNRIIDCETSDAGRHGIQILNNPSPAGVDGENYIRGCEILPTADEEIRIRIDNDNNTVVANTVHGTISDEVTDSNNTIEANTLI